jgi:hypothetical protein
MAVNQFLPFANDPAARVLDQAAYVALSNVRDFGFDSGIAEPDQLNKVWRQSSAIASMIGQYIADQLGQDVLDDGNAATLLQQYKNALALSSSSFVTPVSVTVNTTTPGLQITQTGTGH